jgi:Holliday junction resolvase RusA-like endonuclease
MIFYFEIPGSPKGKGRPRFTRSGHAYTPESTASYENLVKVCFAQKYHGTQPIPHGVPVEAHITAFFPIPKSASKSRAADMERGFELPTKKPDTDNLAKIVLDALNGMAYHDDAQVVELTVIKTYSHVPRVEVSIYAAE